jgi:hypothetical protein
MCVQAQVVIMTGHLHLETNKSYKINHEHAVWSQAIVALLSFTSYITSELMDIPVCPMCRLSSLGHLLGPKWKWHHPTWSLSEFVSVMVLDTPVHPVCWSTLTDTFLVVLRGVELGLVLSGHFLPCLFHPNFHPWG